MNLRHRTLLRGLGGLGLLWAVVFAIVGLAGSMKPSVEKVEAFQESHPLSEIEDPEERRKVIGKMADMLNRMDAEEVSLLARRGEGDPRQRFFGEMTPDEQVYFLERRVGRAFQQMMVSFNQMKREERKEMVERSLRQMRDNAGTPDRLEERDPEMVEKIAEAGFKAYYADASVETKIDLAPLMEEMQSVMSRFGGRPR